MPTNDVSGALVQLHRTQVLQLLDPFTELFPRGVTDAAWVVRRVLQIPPPPNLAYEALVLRKGEFFEWAIQGHRTHAEPVPPRRRGKLGKYDQSRRGSCRRATTTEGSTSQSLLSVSPSVRRVSECSLPSGTPERRTCSTQRSDKR